MRRRAFKSRTNRTLSLYSPKSSPAHIVLPRPLHRRGCGAGSLNNVGPAELSHSGAGRLHSFDGKGTERRAAAGSGSAPDAWLEIEPQFAEALLGRDVGHELIVITLDARGPPRRAEEPSARGLRAVRSPASLAPAYLRGRTRSGCIPWPCVRLIWATARQAAPRIRIGPIEAFDGTPVVDIKSASTRGDG